MFWSKKSKSEKNYEQAARPVKGAAISAKGASVKGAKKAGIEKVPAMDAKASSVAVSGKRSLKPVAKAVTPSVLGGSSSDAASVIIRPHVTEKSGLLSQSGVYTFQISKNATKSSVAKAMAALYNVTPVRVAMINLPSKRVFVRGKRGIVSGIRKAMITVKEGEKIDFV